jgi:hypothetical protein
MYLSQIAYLIVNGNTSDQNRRGGYAWRLSAGYEGDEWRTLAYLLTGQHLDHRALAFARMICPTEPAFRAPSTCHGIGEKQALPSHAYTVHDFNPQN